MEPTLIPGEGLKCKRKETADGTGNFHPVIPAKAGIRPTLKEAQCAVWLEFNFEF